MPSWRLFVFGGMALLLRGKKMMPHDDTPFDPDFAGPSDWARMYRRNGIQVVPAHYPMTEPNHKRPPFAWKEFQNELVSDAIFEKWFSREAKPKPNMGMITGAASGNLLCIDLDDYKHKGSGQWFAEIMGADPETWTQRTGGGGRQMFFRLPDGVSLPNGASEALGVDIRGQGGFAMLPPSEHLSGNNYAWLPGCAPWECELDVAPQRLIDAVQQITGTASSDNPEQQHVKTASPDHATDEWGNITDGREEYMARIVWAAVVDMYRECPIFVPADSDVAMKAAFETYERKTKSRINQPGTPNHILLEREGRGISLFRQKWQYAARQWDGKVREAAGHAPKTDPEPDIDESEADISADSSAKMIISAAEFVAGFKPPEYLIDGMIQKGYLYSLTAKTGHGKTAVTMAMAQAVARGVKIRDREVTQGSVLILAGENPDDVRARLLVLAEAYQFDVTTAPIHFIPGVIDIKESLARIKSEAAAIGDIALVIVDTAAAYYKGDDGNSNVQQGDYARILRGLCGLQGRPTVIVNSHPTKNASKDNMVPMGGSAFVNEVDGNLTLWSGGEGHTQLHWFWKFRGPEFEPIDFKMETKTSDSVADVNGVLMPSVVAFPIGDSELEMREAEQESDERILLSVIGMNARGSVATLAKKANWQTSTGQPAKSKVFRLCSALIEDNLIKRVRKRYIITPAGKAELGWNDDE